MSRPAVRRPLPARAPPRRRRHVDGPARVRHAARALRRGQAAGRAPRRRRRLRRALPPRGAGRRPARAPEHRAGLRLRHRRAAAAASSSSWSTSTGQSCAEMLREHGPPRRPTRPSTSSRRPAAGSTTRTATASSTATSSPATCCATPSGVVKLADFGIAKAAERLRHHAGRLGARHRRLPRRPSRPAARPPARLGPLLARRRRLPAPHRPPALPGRVADRARPPAGERAADATSSDLEPDVPPALGAADHARAARRPAPPATSSAPEMERALRDGLRGVPPGAGRRDRRPAAATSATRMLGRRRTGTDATRAMPPQPRTRRAAGPLDAAARAARAPPAPRRRRAPPRPPGAGAARSSPFLLMAIVVRGAVSASSTCSDLSNGPQHEGLGGRPLADARRPARRRSGQHPLRIATGGRS